MIYYFSENGPATFEEAIRNTGFGKFNVMLVACCTCGIFSPLFETTTMSYIFAPAHCDLELTLQDKGYLNSACYAGMSIFIIMYKKKYATHIHKQEQICHKNM